jgi:hypothetical protein
MRLLMVTLCALILNPIVLWARDWDAFMTQTPQTQYPVEIDDTKSPRTAILLSAVIPGGGQLYSGSYWKAAAFIALEAAAWTFYVTKRQEGYDLEEDFEAFADEHWSEDTYWEYISLQSGIEYTPETLEQLRAWERENFSHGLHRNKDQQYYEMIGKYHQFNVGWEDANPNIGLLDEEWNLSYVSDKRLDYEYMQKESNDAFQMATLAASVALVNHVLSAVDAGFTVKRHNDKLSVTPSIEPLYVHNSVQPVFSLRVHW